MRYNLIHLTVTPLLFAASCAQNTAKEDSRPNILFIFADDWGFGDLGCYGNTEVMTPNLDRLAAEGTRYTQFHVASGVSSPSRTGVITGQYPARHRVHGHFAPNEVNERRGMPNWLDVNFPVMLPRMMQQSGYTTSHIGKWHLGGGGAPNGDLTAPIVAEYGYDEARAWNGNGPTWKGDQKYPTTRFMDDDHEWVHSSSRIAVDEAIDFMRRKKDGGKPMYIDLWLKDPHNPLAPTDEQRAMYKEYPMFKEIYYSVLTDSDYHIGRLMEAMEQMGLDENTIIIFSSDNGPAGYLPASVAGSTGGLRGHKTHLFQGGVCVPFIMKWKGHIEEGAVNDTSVLSAVDLLPTFCEVAGLELPADYAPDGESFASLLTDNEFRRSRPIFWDWHFSNPRTTEGEGWAAAAVRDGEWKLLMNEPQTYVELFNIAADPNETTDLSKLNPEVTARLKALWCDWKATLPK